jgi:hypothetical protein
MSIYDLTVSQLKRAAAIKEQIEKLNKELRTILGPPARSRAALKKSQTMSASIKKRIAAAQKARWATLRRAKRAAAKAARPALKTKKRVGAATRAKLSAKLKAYWAAKKAGRK